MLSRIGNRIIADNQRRMFDKLLQENIGFFADRHSSEFIARLTTGAAAVSGVINLLITAIGRDLMSLIGLSIVMVIQDPVMSLIGFLAAPPAFFFLRKLVRRVRGIAQMQFTGGTRIIETHAGSAAGHAHGQGLRAGRRDAATTGRAASPRSSTNRTKWRGSRTAPVR